MHELLQRALKGVDLNAPDAAWHIFRNLMAMIPWWQLTLWNVLFIVIGALLGRWRGRTAEGLAWGALLGPIGWLVIVLRPRRARPQAASRD